MTKQNPILEGKLREIKGRKVKNLRKEGIIPASIYGKGMESITIQLDGKSVEALFSELGESGLISLMIDKDEYPILLRNPQYNVLTEEIMHIDCYKVNLKEKITAAVPVELVGEAPGVKAGNVLVAISDEVEIEALPADLPDKLEIDISTLMNDGDMISAGDIKLGAEMELKSSPDQVLVKIETPKVVEEEEVEEEVEELNPEDVPASKQKTEEEKAESEEKKDKEKEENKE